MEKPRTHFEQVSLEIVKKIVEDGILRETIRERAPIRREKKSEKGRLATQKQAIAKSRQSFEIEVAK